MIFHRSLKTYHFVCNQNMDKIVYEFQVYQGKIVTGTYRLKILKHRWRPLTQNCYLSTPNILTSASMKIRILETTQMRIWFLFPLS